MPLACEQTTNLEPILKPTRRKPRREEGFLLPTNSNKKNPHSPNSHALGNPQIQQKVGQWKEFYRLKQKKLPGPATRRERTELSTTPRPVSRPVVGLCACDILSGPAPLNSVLATPSETACACGCRVRARVCVRVQCMHVCTRVQCACVHVHVHVCAFLKHLKIRPGKVPSAEHRAEDPAPARGTMAAGAGRPFSD